LFTLYPTLFHSALGLDTILRHPIFFGPAVPTPVPANCATRNSCSACANGDSQCVWNPSGVCEQASNDCLVPNCARQPQQCQSCSTFSNCNSCTYGGCFWNGGTCSATSCPSCIASGQCPPTGCALYSTCSSCAQNAPGCVWNPYWAVCADHCQSPVDAIFFGCVGTPGSTATCPATPTPPSLHTVNPYPVAVNPFPFGGVNPSDCTSAVGCFNCALSTSPTGAGCVWNPEINSCQDVCEAPPGTQFPPNGCYRACPTFFYFTPIPWFPPTPSPTNSPTAHPIYRPPVVRPPPGETPGHLPGETPGLIP